jgi:hypothetical protein
MNKFSKRSLEQLSTCDQRLQDLFTEVLQEMDCTIIEGHRGKEKQDRMVEEGKSKTKWPRSKHNTLPSKAVDVMPYPIDWNDMERLQEFASIVKKTAKRMNIKIKWGGDFESFFDGPHWELDE